MAGTTANQFSFGSFTWWTGVVEDRMDPKKLGRVRVRVFGYHTDDLNDIPTDKLMWATVVEAINSAAISGVGDAPVGILPGTHVVGFFMDGSNAQTPCILGTLGGIPAEKRSGKGFGDPNGEYPKYPIGEADTNRLARNEKIDKTIVKQKRDDIDEADKAFGGNWKEPKTPYNAKYPYNQVKETESGHIEEFDNTEGSERIHQWHRKGTFYEIHPDGTKVTKIVKDQYEVVLGDDYCHVRGDCKITVDGDAHILVKGDCNTEIKGDKKVKVHGDYKLDVLGNMDYKIKGHYYNTSDTHTKFKAPRIDLN